MFTETFLFGFLFGTPALLVLKLQLLMRLIYGPLITLAVYLIKLLNSTLLGTVLVFSIKKFYSPSF